MFTDALHLIRLVLSCIAKTKKAVAIVSTIFRFYVVKILK